MTSCRNCQIEWDSLTLLHCSNCHDSFGGEESFGTHRVRGKCKEPREMGLIVGPTGLWYSENEWWSAEKMEKVRKARGQGKS